MEFLIWALFTLITPLVISVFAGCWIAQYLNGGVKIRYKDFVMLYYINKSKWDLDRMKYADKPFRFGLLGFMRYTGFKWLTWARGHKSRVSTRKTKYNKQVLVFIADAQKDLDSYIKELEHNTYLK